MMVLRAKKIINYLKEFLEELEQYRKIGSVNVCENAVQRCTPIEADYEGDSIDEDGNYIYDTWICPTCRTRYEIDVDDYDYCPTCGQRVTRKEIGQ